jgi:hypothetical protein
VGEQTRALVPTVEELFDLLCKALQQGRSVMGAPITCPQILMTDERSALSALEVSRLTSAACCLFVCIWQAV